MKEQLNKKHQLIKEYHLHLLEMQIYLGLQVKQMEQGTFLCQSKYYKELLKKFEMDKCKEASTPICTSCYVDLDEKGDFVDQIKYRGLIGSLLYLTTSRPDIMFSVCMCVRFQFNPKESHFKARKRILKYLKGTINVGLWYPRGAPIELDRLFRLRFCRLQARP